MGYWIATAFLLSVGGIEPAEAQEACAMLLSQSLSAGYYPAVSGTRDTTHQAEFLARARSICNGAAPMAGGTSWADQTNQTECVADCLETIAYVPPGAGTRALNLLEVALPRCVSGCPRYASFGSSTDPRRHGCRAVSSGLLDRCIRRFTEPGYGLVAHWEPGHEQSPRDVQIFLHRGFALEVCLESPEIWSRTNFLSCMRTRGGELLTAAQYSGPAVATFLPSGAQAMAISGRRPDADLATVSSAAGLDLLSTTEVTLLRNDISMRAIWDCQAPTPSEVGARMMGGLESLYEMGRSGLTSVGEAMGLVSPVEPDPVPATGESSSRTGAGSVSSP